MSVIGSLAAFDHWRQRVYLIESVPVLGLSAAELDAAYDDAVDAGRRRRSPTSASRCRTSPVAPPEPGDELPEMRSSMSHGMYQQAVEVAKEHIRAGDIFQVVLAQRFDIDLQADPFDVYRVLRQINPSPYMYFLRHPRASPSSARRPSRWSVLRQGKVDRRGRSPAPAAAGATTTTTGAWPAS